MMDKIQQIACTICDILATYVGILRKACKGGATTVSCSITTASGDELTHPATSTQTTPHPPQSHLEAAFEGDAPNTSRMLVRANLMPHVWGLSGRVFLRTSSEAGARCGGELSITMIQYLLR